MVNQSTTWLSLVPLVGASIGFLSLVISSISAYFNLFFGAPKDRKAIKCWSVSEPVLHVPVKQFGAKLRLGEDLVDSLVLHHFDVICAAASGFQNGDVTIKFGTKKSGKLLRAIRIRPNGQEGENLQVVDGKILYPIEAMPRGSVRSFEILTDGPSLDCETVDSNVKLIPISKRKAQIKVLATFCLLMFPLATRICVHDKYPIWVTECLLAAAIVTLALGIHVNRHVQSR